MMRAFEVKKGTIVNVIAEGKEWFSYNFEEHECQKDNLFFVEDICVDPLGHVGCRPNEQNIGGAYAKAGYYGFRRDGYVVLVSMGNVIVH